MFRNILVAFDGSKVSERAFQAAVQIAHAFDGRVRVVSVIAVPESPLGNVIPVAFEAEREWILSAMAELVSSVPANSCPVETEIAFGAPAAVLLERARAHESDHIVIGRTGKGAMQRMLIGSVSREIAHAAPVAVTIVP